MKGSGEGGVIRNEVGSDRLKKDGLVRIKGRRGGKGGMVLISQVVGGGWQEKGLR